MKLFPRELSKLIDLIKQKKINSLLLFGPNRGLIEVIIKKILKAQNFIVTKEQYKNLTPENFFMKLNNKNLFNNQEFLKIENVTDTINKDIKNILLTSELVNFPCFIGDNSLSKRGLRSFFEDSPSLAVIACYNEEQQNLITIITQQCRKNGITITPEAVEYLASHLQGEQNIVRSELKKLFSYVHDTQNITIEDVLSVLSADHVPSTDQMCIAFAKRDYSRFEKELTKIQQQNIGDIIIVRALIRYFLNIYYVLSYVENDFSLDSAMKKLAPPIFYKHIPDFKQVIRMYNSKDAIEMIRELYKCEIQLKKNPNPFQISSILLMSANNTS